MDKLLNGLEEHFSGRYEIARSEIKHAQRLTLSHLDQTVNVDLFTSGKVVVGGKDSPLKTEVQELVENFRKDPEYFSKLKGKVGVAKALEPQEAILQHVSQELFTFLPDHDRRALIATYQILLSDLKLDDYSPVIMPVGRVYEGFIAKMLVRLGVCTQTAVQDVNFRFEQALYTPDAKKFKTKAPTHEPKLDAMKQRLKEFRHIQLHSMSSEFVQCTQHEEAKRFIERILGDIQSFFDYFEKHFE